MAALPATSDSPSAAVMASPDQSRYVMRKRARISYAQQDSDDSGNGTDSSEVATKRVKRAPKPLPKKKIFPFMSLPAELRNAIYQHTLADDNGVYLISKTRAFRRNVERAHVPVSDRFSTNGGMSRRRAGRYVRYWKRYGQGNQPTEEEQPALPAFIPALLALNKQIAEEATPILYSSNHFIVEDTTALYAFLTNIGPRNAALLQEITVRGWGYTKAHKAMNHPALTALAMATNLETIYIDCPIGWGPYRATVQQAMCARARQIYRDGFHWLDAFGIANGKVEAAADLIELGDYNFSNGRYVDGKSVVVDRDEQMQMFREELSRLIRNRGKSGRTSR